MATYQRINTNISVGSVTDLDDEVIGNTTAIVTINNRIVNYEDVSIKRKVGTGADVGAVALNGQFELSYNDYIEVYVTSDLGGTVTFDRIAINIKEIN